MDLHRIASGVISAVNPMQNLVLKASTGYTVNGAGRQVPVYADPVTIPGQVQPLTYKDLRQLDSLNIQGSTNAIYFDQAVNAIVRADRKGGDLVTAPDGKVYLTTQVLEAWPDWTKVAVTLQNGA